MSSQHQIEPFGPDRLKNAQRLDFAKIVESNSFAMCQRFSLEVRVRDAGDVILVNRRRFVRYYLFAPRPDISITIGPVFLSIPLFPFGRDVERILSKKVGMPIIGSGAATQDELIQLIANRSGQISSLLDNRF